MHIRVVLEQMLYDFLYHNNNYTASSEDEMRKDFVDSVIAEVELFTEDEDWERHFELLEARMQTRRNRRVMDGEPL